MQFKTISVLIIFLFLWFHPIHVSVTNVEYFPETSELELSTKIFKDDFQLLFVHLNELNIEFENEDSIHKYQDEIDSYIRKNLKVIIHENECKYYFKDYKINDEAIWLSYTMKITDEIESLKIKNTLLLDLYFDQKNLLILKAGDYNDGFQFNLKHKEHIFDVN
ncbi:MAG: hypothetical protein JEY96_05960 [Bacteroidales bacterium]|nr:hypothetical protein [Bacteroidales bacterium]